MPHFLVIEDSQTEQIAVRGLLADIGDVTAVTSLAGAAAVLRSRGVDLAVLDLGLDDSHGLQTISKFRDLAPFTPIVVVTSVDDVTETLVIDRGALALVPKDNLAKLPLVASGVLNESQSRTRNPQIDAAIGKLDMLAADVRQLASGVSELRLALAGDETVDPPRIGLAERVRTLEFSMNRVAWWLRWGAAAFVSLLCAVIGAMTFG